MRNSSGKREKEKRNKGFTLLEIIIVMVIISVLGLLIIPRMSGIFNVKRNNFLILTATIAKTFDDSYINSRINALVVHLYEPGEETEEENEIYSRRNGISVVTFEKGLPIDSKNKNFKPREFPDSFKIEEILLPGGITYSTGYVTIPFYPEGYSDNVILHILVNEEERWSVRIFKMRKEPEIIYGYIDFETEK